MWITFMFHPCLHIMWNMYFIFSNGRGKETHPCPCIIHESSCHSSPASGLSHFKAWLPCLQEKISFSLLVPSCLFAFFSLIPACGFSILRMFPNLCWHLKNEHSVVLMEFFIVYFSVSLFLFLFFFFFFEQYFPKLKLFSQYSKFYVSWSSKYTEIFIFYFHLKELHFI